MNLIHWLVLAFAVYALLFVGHADAAKYNDCHSFDTEALFVKAYCPGDIEVGVGFGLRADCVTHDEVIEFDWSHKYHEGLGQALEYAQLTSKRAVLRLIVTKESEWIGVDHVMRANGIIDRYNLPIELRPIYCYKPRI